MVTKTRRQLSRFLVVGFTTVTIDFVFYNIFLMCAVPLDVAKAASFIVGAVFAYVANKSWTFMQRKHGAAPLLFAGVYAATLFVNISVNGIVVRALPEGPVSLGIAFVIATGISAALNFIAMKWIVFRKGASLKRFMPVLSLVIPCYNEVRNLPELIGRCRKVIAQGDIEIILVDNGSRDDTPVILADAMADQENLRSVRVDVNAGYGNGILAGLRAGRGDILGWTHADLQTDPTDALRGLELFKQNPGQKIFVKGRRYGRGFGDVAFTFGMSCLETVLFAMSFWDINAQPTMFPRALFDTWQDPPHDFALDLYAYWSARRSGYTVKRFPVHFGPRFHGVSSWNNNWHSRLKMILRVAGYSWQLRRKIVE